MERYALMMKMNLINIEWHGRWPKERTKVSSSGVSFLSLIYCNTSVVFTSCEDWISQVSMGAVSTNDKFHSSKVSFKLQNCNPENMAWQYKFLWHITRTWWLSDRVFMGSLLTILRLSYPLGYMVFTLLSVERSISHSALHCLLFLFLQKSSLGT